jgi:competence protein ComEA
VPSLTLTRRQALIAAALALAVVFAAAHFLGRSGSGGSSYSADGSSGDAPALSTPAGTSEDDASGAESGTGVPVAAAPTEVVVDVAGAVRRPGVYRLSQGSRITDAIARAGGMTAHAQAASVDLAAPLADGEQVLVPSAAAGAVAAGSPPARPSVAPTASAPVDLNTATAEQLDALPGIGPTTAQKIIDYRQQHGPYTSIDDLDAISGIGPAKIDSLRGLVIA